MCVCIRGNVFVVHPIFGVLRGTPWPFFCGYARHDLFPEYFFSPISRCRGLLRMDLGSVVRLLFVSYVRLDCLASSVES